MDLMMWNTAPFTFNEEKMAEKPGKVAELWKVKAPMASMCWMFQYMYFWKGTQIMEQIKYQKMYGRKVGKIIGMLHGITKYSFISISNIFI